MKTLVLCILLSFAIVPAAIAAPILYFKGEITSVYDPGWCDPGEPASWGPTYSNLFWVGEHFDFSVNGAITYVNLKNSSVAFYNGWSGAYGLGMGISGNHLFFDADPGQPPLLAEGLFNQVPEPATLFLLCLGVAPLLFMVTRRAFSNRLQPW